MVIPIVQVDAFTDVPFRGNPAVVCLLAGPRDAAWMQAVAREMNLAETAFLVPVAGGFGLRWFTPAVEVDLCGHATLAAAHVLWETGTLPATATARFDTRSGCLTATRAGALVWLDFPREEALAAPAPAALLAALDVKPLWTGRNRFDWLVEVDSDAAVRGLAPDLVRLRTVDARGVIVTSAAAGGAPGPDFVSRFFAPRAGIDEDPVTGSAHCALGPYWAARLGHADLTGYQASARGGTIAVHVGADRVAIGGRAVTVLRGLLTA